LKSMRDAGSSWSEIAKVRLSNGIDSNPSYGDLTHDRASQLELKAA
jgi:hypothetical protein